MLVVPRMDEVGRKGEVCNRARVKSGVFEAANCTDERWERGQWRGTAGRPLADLAGGTERVGERRVNEMSDCKI